jgi:hypothetical protein
MAAYTANTYIYLFVFKAKQRVYNVGKNITQGEKHLCLSSFLGTKHGHHQIGFELY